MEREIFNTVNDKIIGILGGTSIMSMKMNLIGKEAYGDHKSVKITGFYTFLDNVYVRYGNDIYSVMCLGGFTDETLSTIDTKLSLFDFSLVDKNNNEYVCAKKKH